MLFNKIFSKVRGSIAGFMGGGESIIAIAPTGHTLPLITVILESQSLLGVLQGKPQA